MANKRKVRKPLTDQEIEGLPTVLGVKDVASMLMICDKTVRDMAKRGDIPSKQIGLGGNMQFRFFKPSILEWLAGSVASS